MRALLAIDDPEGWRDRIFRAFVGLNPDDGLEADALFGRWLSAGIARHLPATDVAALERQYRKALDDLEPGTTERVSDLAQQIEKAGDSNEHRALLGRALLIVARRSAEDGDLEGARVAAERAETIFGTLGDAKWSSQAMRVRAGILIRLEKLDEALALIDKLFAGASAWFTIEGMFRPTADLFAEASTILLSCAKEDEAWIHIVGKIAARSKHAGFTQRDQELAGRLPGEPGFWDRDD